MKRKHTAKNRANPPGRHWPAVLVIALAAGAILIIAAAGGTAYAINRENHDTFCASCHTQPEVDYVQQAQDQNPASLAAFHAHQAVRCIDCHSGSGPFGRAVGLEQGAQDLIAYYGKNYHDPAITTNPIGDNTCDKCHGNLLDNRSFDNHFHLFLQRWQGLDTNAAHCVDCHASHQSGDPNQGFLIRDPVVTVCQHCHAALGRG